MYNNQPQHYAELCVEGTCTWIWGYTAVVYPLQLENGDAFVGWGQQAVMLGQDACYKSGDNNELEYCDANWSLQTADGTKHVLGNRGTASFASEGSNLWYQVSTGPFEALDATGWGAIGSCTAYIAATNGCSAAILDSDGVSYGATQKDPNGNLITSNSTTITDSLGKSIPLPPNITSTLTTGTSNCPVVNGTPASKYATWTPPGYNGAAATYTFCYGDVTVNTPSGEVGGLYVQGGGPGSAPKLQSIVLPNGQSWQFEYVDSDGTNYMGVPTNFGTLSQITLPTGGTISYTYQYGGSSVCGTAGRLVASRTVTDESGAHTWTYTYNSGNTVVTDPVGNDVVHTFGYPTSSGYCSYYETQTQYYQGSHASGTLLKTVNTAYSGAASANTPSSMVNLVPTSISTVWPNGQTSTVSKTYDAGFSYTNFLGNAGNPGLYGKEVSKSESDYGGALLRTTNTSYAWQGTNSPYLTNNLLDSVSTQQILDGGGTQRALTTYGYDGSSLVSSGVTEQHVAGESYPGNQTSVHRWLNTSNSYLVTNRSYYDTGMVDQVTDPLSHPTNYAYSSTYFGAYPTSVTNAANQVTQYAYDFNTGLRTSIVDPNNQPTTYGYDEMWRISSASFPDGGSASYNYDDTPGSLSVEVQHTMNGSQSTNEYMLFDGLGRETSRSKANDESTPWDKTDTCYDARGLKNFVSYPYQASGYNSAQVCAAGGDSYLYDALKRTTLITHSDNSTITTVYSGSGTSVTDEGNGTAATQRISQTDGLGRLISLCEMTSTTLLVGLTPQPSSPCNSLFSGAGFPTTYQYDALNNLTSVTQGGLNVRSFAYDSLSRLITASNPESGTTCYGTWSGSTCVSGYDADGNMTQRTRPAPNQTGTTTLTTTYAYDALNRMASKTYSDGEAGAYFYYDQTSWSGTTLTNPIGRLTSEGTYNGNWLTSGDFSYDPMGRVILNSQDVPTNYNLTYAYDYVGDVTSFINGVGVTFGFTPNRAQRLTTVTSNDTAGGPGTLLSLGHYNAFGSMLSSTLGNGVTESYGYTPRGWLNSFQAESPGIVVKQATPGTGTVTVNGSEKSIITATPGKGSVTISGTEQSTVIDPCQRPVPPCPVTVYDVGDVSITVNGFVAQVTYGETSTDASVASALESALNVSSSPVTATVNGAVVSMTAKTNGSVTNYSLSATSETTSKYFTVPSFKPTPSGSTLTGGTGPTTVYDTGTVTVTVNGTVKASPSYGSSSAGSNLASALASALNGSLVTATASGNVVTITSVATGEDTNYSLAVSSASNDPSQFNPPSFTMSESGSTLTGGANEQTSNGPAYTLAVGYAGDGDVTSASDSANGNWSYSYDAMNRLTQAAIGSAALNYVYDRFGNRWQQNASGNGSWPQPQYSFDANNHIVGGSYDAAGNLLNDGTHTYTYDAENRISTVDGGNTATYTYDAEGRRASKNTFTYLYDLAGHQVAELNSGSWDRGEAYAGGRHLATYSGGTTYFPHVDWLGTERVRTNAAGNIAETCISLPFGDGQSCTGSDSSPMHFTGKQRDTESNLDYFGARYNASSMGRFMTPDIMGTTPIHLINAQRWNMYSYVVNNPLTYVDPDGMDAIAVNFTNEVPGGGHEGIVSVKADGSAQYASFGPAHADSPSDQGKVDVQSLSSVSFKSDGLPTDASYKQLADQVAKIEGQDPSTVRMNYFKTSSADTAALNAWIARIKAASDAGKAPDYDVSTQNCATFCRAGLIQGNATSNGRFSNIPNVLFNQLSLLAQENYANGQRSPKEVVTHKICDGQGGNCQ